MFFGSFCEKEMDSVFLAISQTYLCQKSEMCSVFSRYCVLIAFIASSVLETEGTMLYVTMV